MLLICLDRSELMDGSARTSLPAAAVRRAVPAAAGVQESSLTLQCRCRQENSSSATVQLSITELTPRVLPHSLFKHLSPHICLTNVSFHPPPPQPSHLKSTKALLSFLFFPLFDLRLSLYILPKKWNRDVWRGKKTVLFKLLEYYQPPPPKKITRLDGIMIALIILFLGHFWGATKTREWCGCLKISL